MGHRHVRIVGGDDSMDVSLSDRLAGDSRTYSVSDGTFPSPPEGLDAVDCIVTVHDPPADDAIDVLRSVRDERPDLPVVVYAVESSESLAVRAVNGGASRYVRAGDYDEVGPRLSAAVEAVFDESEATGTGAERDPGLDEILRRLPTPAFAIDDTHAVTHWNNACEELLEHDADEIVGTTNPFKAFYDEPRPVLADLVLDGSDPAEISEWYDDWAESQYIDDAVVGEDYFPDHDVWLRFAATPIEDETGEVVAAVETLEDITLRKKREAKLREFKEAVDQSGTAVVITDATGDIEYVNPAFESQTGYEGDEVIGRSASVLRSDRFDETQYDEFWKTIEAGDVWESVIVNERKDGTEYHAKQTVSPVWNEDGSLAQLVAIESDVTGRIQQSQQIQVQNRILRHNLRNALAVVVGRAETALSRVEADEARDDLETILDVARDLETVSEKAAHIEPSADVSDTDLGPVDLAAILRREQNAFRSSYPDVSLTVDVPDDLSVLAHDLLSTAVHEVVENAVEHNEPDGLEVSLSARPDGSDKVELRIADMGSGIPESELEVIEAGTETPLAHGSGLGLWLVNWIVTSSGGEVSCENNDPRGTVMRIRLPAVEE